MLRSLISAFILTAAFSQAALLPDEFSDLKRVSVTGAVPEDRALWDEYGFESGETAVYSGSAGGTLTVTAWRFHDTTGAFAAHRARPDSVQRDNYLLQLDGTADINALANKLPNRVSTALPPQHLPKSGRIAGSERYLLGPASLSRFEPRISPDLAAFDRGAEAETARYRSGAGELQVTIFSYPTPQMAIERFRKFEQIPNAATRRSGTLIAIVPEAKASGRVAKLLDETSYNPKLTWNEYVPKATTQDAAKMILAISVLAAGLIVASVVLGLFFGGWKILARRFGMKPAEEDFTSLHISDRQISG